MKKFVSLFMTLLLVLSSFGTMASASSQSFKEKEKMVEESFNYSIKSAKGDEKEKLKTDLAKFKKLSKEDKKKFISYMFDPEVTSTIAESISEVEPGETKALKNGDIVLSATYEESDVEAPALEEGNIQPLATTYYKKAWYKRGVSFLGLTVLEVYAQVNYTHNGSKVLSTYGCDAYTSRNLNPTVDYEWGRCIRNHSSSQAWATASVKWSAIYSGLGIVYANHEVRVWGNYKNQSGGSVTKL